MDSSLLPNLLPIYYKYLFPFNPYYQWLNYNQSKDDLETREFSFTLQRDNSETYIRYLSFCNQNELEKEVLRFCPYKIDIGAIYNLPPKDHKRYPSGKFKALTKELVFDIDMTDYDDVRVCCQGTDICNRCWTLMKISVKIIDGSLREDFGFKQILWVYSGRRGVHCWVCDSSARRLSAHARVSIVDYLTVLKAGKLDKKVVLRSPVHPYIRRCVEVAGSYWNKFAVEDQQLFENKNSFKNILKMITDVGLKEKISAATKDLKDSEQIWQTIRLVCKQLIQENPRREKLRHLTSEIILEFCSPRLDANVSKSVNHLLKSPFSVHPKTGRICVPIDPEDVDSFDPFNVPTISDICLELEKLKSDSQSGEKEKNLYNRTSLAKYMKVFEKFVSRLRVQEAKEEMKNKISKDSVDF